jgi:hypothetical protein
MGGHEAVRDEAVTPPSEVLQLCTVGGEVVRLHEAVLRPCTSDGEVVQPCANKRARATGAYIIYLLGGGMVIYRQQ